MYQTPPQLTAAYECSRVLGCYWQPNGPFVNELAAFFEGKRVLEIFAGNGYLAACLQHRGITVTATTQFSGHDAHDAGLYFPVEELSALEAIAQHGANHDVLLVCWPTVTPAVLAAALCWGQGRDIVFIGEVTDYSKGHLGGCATDEFFERIKRVRTFNSYQGNMLEAAFVCQLTC